MEKNPLKRLIGHFFSKPTTGGGKSTRVASVQDLSEGKPFCADVGGKEIAIFKIGEKYHAIDNVCPHLGGPLCKGPIANGVVTCPWHGSDFKIETGALLKGPAKTGVKTYPVEIRGNDVYVTLGPI